MTKSHLRACTACARHVRVTEASCPFCGVALSADFRATPAPIPPRARLSRAALFAFGTGAMAMAPACSSTEATQAVDAGQDTGTFAGADAYGGFPMGEDAYGGPPMGEPAYGGGPVEVIDAAYGGPPLDLDSGPPADASDAGDSGPTDASDGGDQ